MSKSSEFPKRVNRFKVWALRAYADDPTASQGDPGSSPSSVAGGAGAGLCRRWGQGVPGGLLPPGTPRYGWAWPFQCPGAVKDWAAAGGGRAGLGLSYAVESLRPHRSLACAQFLS